MVVRRTTLLKKNQNINGVKNQIRRHKEKEMEVVVGNSWLNVSSEEKLDIDLMSVLRDLVRKEWKGISWHMKIKEPKLQMRVWLN